MDGRIAAVLYPNGLEGIWSYDAAGRVSSLVWRNAATWQTVVAYAAVYDNAGRLTQITEQPSGDVTTFSYDNAGRLTAENRTGQRAYSSAYSYDSRGNRLTAVRSEGGIVSHDGAYTYDDASRLIQVVDSATNQTEVYTWFDDNTLASYPGPGYTRLLDYDEEGRLTRIRKDFGGGNIQLAYEYGYGFDGGRRWRKDYSQNPWTWYPCGVACCAGDLVEMESDLNGINWTTTAQYLKADSIVRRNSEFHLWDITGKAQVITDGIGAAVANDLYDAFGVRRFSNGFAATPTRWRAAEGSASQEAEGLARWTEGTWFLPHRQVPTARHAGTQRDYDPQLALENTAGRQVDQIDDPRMKACHKQYLKDLKACGESAKRCKKWFFLIPYWCDARWAVCVGNALAKLKKCQIKCGEQVDTTGVQEAIS